MYIKSDFDCISSKEDKLFAECKTIEIEWRGEKRQVRKLNEEEAMAKISAEYGFEFGTIKIIGDCWYEATDWNYFKFTVRDKWKYEVHDYGALEVLDWYDD